MAYRFFLNHISSGNTAEGMKSDRDLDNIARILPWKTQGQLTVVKRLEWMRRAREVITILMIVLPVNSDKTITRKEIVQKKKAIQELIKPAYAERGHLSPFQIFCHYCRMVYLYTWNKISSSDKKYIQTLLKVHLEWSMEEKVKRREMFSSDGCYIFVHEISTVSANGMSSTSYIERSNASLAEKCPLIAFVQYQFSTEEDIPVLYAYELQIEPCIQGRGLGKYLMQLIELIARKNCMDAVMLTVQKANSRALHFYTSTLRYVISTISPSRVDPSEEKLELIKGASYQNWKRRHWTFSSSEAVFAQVNPPTTSI